MFASSAASSRLWPAFGMRKLRVAPSSVTVASVEFEVETSAETTRFFVRPGWPEAKSSNLICSSASPCSFSAPAIASIIGSGPQMKAVVTVGRSIQVRKSAAHFSASTRPVKSSMSCASDSRTWTIESRPR